MGKFLTILLFYLCSTFFVQGADSLSVYTECDSVEFASRYQVQIDCQRQCNNFAHRSDNIGNDTRSKELAGKGGNTRLGSAEAHYQQQLQRTIFSLSSLWQTCHRLLPLHTLSVAFVIKLDDLPLRTLILITNKPTKQR